MAPYLALFQWTATLLLAWLAAAAVLVGWGLLVQRAAGTRAGRMGDLVRALWLGVVLTLGFLQLVHLVLPVNGVCLLLWAAVGAIGLVAFGRHVPLLLRDAVRAHPRLAGTAAIVAVVFAGNALGPAALYDTGLYHLQAVRWNQSFPIVTGLGNLHSRLAFNNGSFLWQAMALLGPWRGSGYGIVNGLLAGAVAAQASICLRRLLIRQSHAPFADAVGALLLIPVAVIATKSFYPPYAFFMSSISPDVTVSLLHFAALGHAAQSLTRPGTERLLLATGLLTATVCVKVSSAPFAFVVFMVLVAASVFRHDPGSTRRFGPAVAAVAFSSVLIGTWAIRGVILSGYPLFPSPLLAVDVPWRLPVEATDVMRETLRRWARIPGGESAGEPWLSAWTRSAFGRDPGTFALPFVLVVLGLLMIVPRVRALAASLRSAERRAFAVLLGAAAVALAVWFLAAPDPRYGFQIVFTLAVCLLAAAVAAARSWTAPVIIAASILVLVAARVGYTARRGMPLPKAIIAVTLPIPTSTAGHFVMPESDVHQVTTRSGLVLLMPVEDDRVWDAPLPSTPRLRGLGLDIERLRLRRAGDLASGFVMAEPD